MDISKLCAGDRVAVARHGSWSVHREGIYMVVKADKVKIVLERESDGYVRTFSTKTGIERGGIRSRPAFIETVSEYEAREEQLSKERKIRDLWDELELNVLSKNLAAIRDKIAAIESLKESIRD